MGRKISYVECPHIYRFFESKIIRAVDNKVLARILEELYHHSDEDIRKELESLGSHLVIVPKVRVMVEISVIERR